MVSRFRLIRALAVCAPLFVAGGDATAHEDDVKKPPTKAKAELQKARKQMDAAKQKLAQDGKYRCCVKPPPTAKAGGCDTCAKMHGSCNCGANLAQGKGVCGDCLAGWKTGRGAFPNVNKDEVKLLHSGHQALPDVKAPSPEVAQAQETLVAAKRTLVKEQRFSCCISKGGCDECAYEASCPCAKELAKGEQGKGVCGQCFDGQHAGHGRIQGVDPSHVKLNPEQHGMQEMEGFAGIPHTREASGTAWQPDSTPMHAHEQSIGLWKAMQHYNAFLAYDRQSGPRGDSQFNSINWWMGMASRQVGKGDLMLRVMLSLEPATVGSRGYPLLFQTGETYRGEPLIDRQHPHDFFMELAARYRHPIGEQTAVSLYFAPSGEPALGPVAFPHRVSAMDNPAAPIGHHWQDASHITFGVLTAGISHRNAQLEGSIFTGREPNEERWDIDRMKFDSYSGRLTYNFGPNWSAQGSYGYLHSPEPLHPGDDVRRATFSVMHNQPREDGGNLATTLVWGRNSAHGGKTDSWLLESSLNLANRNTFFGRLERVGKTGEELGLVSAQGLPPDTIHRITQLTLGGVHELTPGKGYQTGVGGALTFNWTPEELKQIYNKSPLGFWLFLRIRPAAMQHGGAQGAAAADGNIKNGKGEKPKADPHKP